ncbi:MAG: DEAD/DEAH box helicase [Planctomycetales bacterium]|nr:DEAD/DEAH box helicase [Planctomycetales bacterium]
MPGSPSVHLRTLAARLLHPTVGADTVGALARVRVAPEPYQVEAVHRMVSAPRCRFLLADDVGLGKTVQAGLLISELAARGRARRTLVVVPAALRDQWLAEMAEKFGETFHVYDAATVKRLRAALPPGANPWGYHTRVLTSLDYLKRAEVAAEATAVDWDLVVVDEAHKLGLALVAGHLSRTERYRLGEALSDATESLVLLTATPHHGDEVAFQGLVALLDPFLLPEEGAVPPARLRGLMIRRGKGEIRDAAGKPVFLPRRVKTLAVEFREDERALYEAVTDHIRERYRAARAENDVVGGFAMVLLQKRLVSSVWALRESLRRRLDALRDAPSAPPSAADLAAYEAACDEPEDLDDSRLQEIAAIERRLEGTRAPRRPGGPGGPGGPIGDGEDEALAVEGLLRRCDAVLARGDSKGATLRRFADGLRAEEPHGKLLVFTEYRDTLEHLAGKLLAHHRPLVIHGGVPVNDRRRIVEEFTRPGPALLVATDAAGEGLNLHAHCHRLVNYELPWNPNRIDQRIGRLHRYGQRREVRVWNLQVADTREGAIFDLLSEKVRRMERALGGRVSEVLGAVLSGVSLADMLMDALAADEPPRVTADHVARAIEERRRMAETVEKGFSAAIPTHDPARATSLLRRSLAVRPGAAAVREFVARAAAARGGSLERGRAAGTFRLRLPGATVPVPELVAFDAARSLGTGGTGAALLDPGHALVQGEARRVLEAPPGAPETLWIPGEADGDGLWALFRVRVREPGGGEESALLPVRVRAGGGTQIGRAVALPPAAAPPPPGGPDEARARALSDHAEALLETAARAAAVEAERLAAERRAEREADARPLDAARSRYVAAKEGEIARREEGLRARAAEGENVAIAIRAEEARRRALRSREERAKAALARRTGVAPLPPERLACALLVGVRTAGPAASAEPRRTPSGMFPAFTTT